MTQTTTVGHTRDTGHKPRERAVVGTISHPFYVQTTKLTARSFAPRQQEEIS